MQAVEAYRLFLCAQGEYRTRDKVTVLKHPGYGWGGEIVWMMSVKCTVTLSILQRDHTSGPHDAVVATSSPRRVICCLKMLPRLASSSLLGSASEAASIVGSFRAGYVYGFDLFRQASRHSVVQHQQHRSMRAQCQY